MSRPPDPVEIRSQRHQVGYIIRFVGDPSGYWCWQNLKPLRSAGWVWAWRGDAEPVMVNVKQAYLIEEIYA